MQIEVDPKKNSSTQPSVPLPGDPSDLTAATAAAAPSERPHETGGPSGPEPTRFGDWERKGRCVDF